MKITANGGRRTTHTAPSCTLGAKLLLGVGVNQSLGTHVCCDCGGARVDDAGQKKVSSPNSQAARAWRFAISKLNNARPGWHAKAIKTYLQRFILGIEKFVVISRKAKSRNGHQAVKLRPIPYIIGSHRKDVFSRFVLFSRPRDDAGRR